WAAPTRTSPSYPSPGPSSTTRPPARGTTRRCPIPAAAADRRPAAAAATRQRSCPTAGCWWPAGRAPARPAPTTSGLPTAAGLGEGGGGGRVFGGAATPRPTRGMGGRRPWAPPSHSVVAPGDVIPYTISYYNDGGADGHLVGPVWTADPKLEILSSSTGTVQ